MTNYIWLKHNLLKSIEQNILNKQRLSAQKHNPKAKRYLSAHFSPVEIIHVEFYLMDAFEIYHYKPIYEHLLSLESFEPIFVCEPTSSNVHGDWFDYERAKKILQELKLNYKETVNKEAEIAISTQNIHTLKKYNKIKINLQYGTGFNKTNFCNTLLSVEGYNYRFVYADYTRRHLSKFIHKNRMYNIGLPKHDMYYQNLPPKPVFDTNKPILVYYPTWDEDCSVAHFYDELKKLKENFFIITKAHHCTFRLAEKKDDLNKLYEISDIVLEGNFDFAKASQIGDIALIDAKSGASTEVPYLNPNIKILYLSPRKNLAKYFYNDIFKFGYIINNPKKLMSYVDRVYKNDKYLSYRQNQISYYMGTFDGNSTQRAVNAIKDIVHTEFQ